MMGTQGQEAAGMLCKEGGGMHQGDGVLRKKRSTGTAEAPARVATGAAVARVPCSYNTQLVAP